MVRAMMQARFTFWGVRGSIAVAERGMLRYGGNTSCLHIEYDGTHLICDAGTGILPLGNALLKRFRGRSIDACILLSHVHWDHYFGLPFFKPLTSRHNSFLIAGPGVGARDFRALLTGAIRPPYFPVRLSAFGAGMELRTVHGKGFGWGGIGVVPVPVNHPDGACGWRFFFPNGRCAVVMSDDEPGPAKRQRKMIRHLEGADVLIHDAQYTPESYRRKRGWGHSPFPYPIALAEDAGIKNVYLTHFDCDDDDRALDSVKKKAARYARERGIRCELAREGLSFLL
jgi:phosphoribosyl 1,2-cyclic phosphodiesterase